MQSTHATIPQDILCLVQTTPNALTVTRPLLLQCSIRTLEVHVLFSPEGESRHPDAVSSGAPILSRREVGRRDGDPLLIVVDLESLQVYGIRAVDDEYSIATDPKDTRYTSFLTPL